MQNVIVGTAGHVDHGKTCLIKALTGINTDRLAEEKKRGITIENGFAYIPNDLGYHIGIIDVPGHEKFVKNMLAGIGGIDLVLFVISLEEGIKPQTVEHFEILNTLGIKKGIIVYTKLDSKNIMNFDILKSQVKDLVKGSFLENSNEIPVSAFTGENIDLLKKNILDIVAEIGQRNENKELTRLPIDRVFTMEGFGTVITGTLVEGKVDTGDELMIYPYQKIVKVRQIESHNKIVPTAFAGQRTAINLLNVKKDDIDRGSVIASKFSFILSDIIDCKIKMFKSAKRKIKNGEKLYFNYGSSQTVATVKIISDEYVQFKFEHPVPVKRNDRYIVRFISPCETCAGGVIICIDSKRYKLDDGTALHHFECLDSNDELVVLLEVINDTSIDFPNVEFISKKINNSIADTIKMLNQLKNESKIIILYSNAENTVDSSSIILSNKFYDGIKKYICDILIKFHKENELMKGIKKEELKSILFKRYSKIGDTILEKLINYLILNNVIKQNEDLISNYDFKVVIDDKSSNAIQNIENLYLSYKYEPQENKIVVDELSKFEFKDKIKLRQLLVDMSKDGTLIKLSKDYYMHKRYFENAVNEVKKIINNKNEIAMPEFRNSLNTSRKYALLILEYLDQKHITEMHGLMRVKGINYNKI